VALSCCSSAVLSTQKRVRRPAQRLRGPRYGSAEAPSMAAVFRCSQGRTGAPPRWSPVCFPSVLRQARAPSEVSHPRSRAELSVAPACR